jgi:hypothetical protein
MENYPGTVAHAYQNVWNLTVWYDAASKAAATSLLLE